MVVHGAMMLKPDFLADGGGLEASISKSARQHTALTGLMGEGRDEMNQRNYEIAHFRIVARNDKLANSARISNSPCTGLGQLINYLPYVDIAGA